MFQIIFYILAALLVGAGIFTLATRKLTLSKDKTLKGRAAIGAGVVLLLLAAVCGWVAVNTSEVVRWLTS